MLHNFGTTVPRYVNWYLDEYVGCDLATTDLRNSRFSIGPRNQAGHALRAAKPQPALPSPNS